MKKIMGEIPAAEREAAAADIARRIWSVPEIASAKVILLFAALADEVPTSTIAAESGSRGIIVTYPRCLPETREMMLHQVSAEGDLIPGQYGILEPNADACPIVQIEDIDVALVPGLAWDRTGARLGRGAGYYDRLFARLDWRAFTCGLFLAKQEIPSIPTDPWDHPLDMILTEQESLRIKAVDR